MASCVWHTVIKSHKSFGSTRGDTQGRSSTEAAIISVKVGQRVGVAMVRDLKGVMERENADISLCVCVIQPTREMEREAASAGVYTDAHTGHTYPRLQIYTLAEYFSGLRPKVPILDRQGGVQESSTRRQCGQTGQLALGQIPLSIRGEVRSLSAEGG